ncbi:hypothetical protein [Sphingomonas bacterium]|uniref:hypothetical protein n=1 Tax=Sphingomonas bacterium TaxID=1895847 RepID=UPI001575B751|nr:hypothetical protein [Sphingomonas bacterium]
MDDDEGVRIIDGVIHIDHPEIEADLHLLAERWQTTPEDALGITLRRALKRDDWKRPEPPR